MLPLRGSRFDIKTGFIWTIILNILQGECFDLQMVIKDTTGSPFQPRMMCTKQPGFSETTEHRSSMSLSRGPPRAFNINSNNHTSQSTSPDLTFQHNVLLSLPQERSKSLSIGHHETAHTPARCPSKYYTVSLSGSFQIPEQEKRCFADPKSE